MRFFVKFISLLALLLLFDACQKENVQDILPSEESEITLRNDEILSNNTFERNRNVKEARPTILEKKRTNPYTVEVMTKAWNRIAPNARIGQVPVTDLYVKFSPTDFDQLAILDELDIELFDHPLDYEIIEMGDYYIPEGVSEDEIPEYYAVVPPNFVFPTEVEYEIIEQLHLAKYDTYLTREAFRMTRNEYAGNPTLTGAPEGTGSNFKECEIDDPNWPICQCDIFIGTPYYQECIEDVTNPPDPPGPTLNDCGCPVSNNDRDPAGIVTVEDSQFGPQPVRNVKIVARDNWFKVRETWTDDNGCWHIRDAYSGSATIIIRFRSDRITVRGIRGARLWEYAFAVRDRFKWNGPDFNDICVNFMPNNDDASPAKKYWYAAHVNNALYEFDEYATIDGIASPPDDLEVLIANYDTSASAPMFNQLTQNPLIALSSWGLVSAASGAAIDISSMLAFTFGFGNIGTILQTVPTPLLSAYFVAFVPDVYYGYGGEINIGNNPNRSSDIVKYVFYHEYGHANQYAALPNRDNYWLLEIAYIILNNGYGDGTAPDAERAAVVEAWGEFIGVVYADRRYGLNHSQADPTNPLVTEERRFIYRGNNSNIEGEGHTPMFPIPGNNQDDWIPWGLFMDCIDDRAHNNPPLSINDPVTDNVQDYTISNCFESVVNGNPITLNQVEQTLIGNLPNGQTVGDVNTLFQEYGF